MMIEFLHALIRKADEGDGIRFAGDVVVVTAGDPNVWGRLDVSDYAVGVCPDPGDVLRTELETVNPEAGIAEMIRVYPFAVYEGQVIDGETVQVMTLACDPAMRQEVE